MSNFCGPSIFNSNKSSSTNSLLDTDNDHNLWGEDLLTTVNKVTANFKTLDSVVSELGINKINLLKLDVQRAEHFVMDGAKEGLKKRNY